MERERSKVIEVLGETVWGPREDHEKGHLAEQQEDQTSTKGEEKDSLSNSCFPLAVEEREGMQRTAKFNSVPLKAVSIR